ncbi:MAG: hypothetical protein ACI8RD_001447 [Bacillariaceae sp.]|jgi:hypothetical protein
MLRDERKILPHTLAFFDHIHSWPFRFATLYFYNMNKSRIEIRTQTRCEQ